MPHDGQAGAAYQLPATRAPTLTLAAHFITRAAYQGYADVIEKWGMLWALLRTKRRQDRRTADRRRQACQGGRNDRGALRHHSPTLSPAGYRSGVALRICFVDTDGHAA
jgi:hypothetical protein